MDKKAFGNVIFIMKAPNEAKLSRINLPRFGLCWTYLDCCLSIRLMDASKDLKTILKAVIV
jgi:hypothetical protein